MISCHTLCPTVCIFGWVSVWICFWHTKLWKRFQQPLLISIYSMDKTLKCSFQLTADVSSDGFPGKCWVSSTTQAYQVHQTHCCSQQTISIRNVVHLATCSMPSRHMSLRYHLLLHYSSWTIQNSVPEVSTYWCLSAVSPLLPPAAQLSQLHITQSKWPASQLHANWIPGQLLILIT